MAIKYDPAKFNLAKIDIAQAEVKMLEALLSGQNARSPLPSDLILKDVITQMPNDISQLKDKIADIITFLVSSENAIINANSTLPEEFIADYAKNGNSVTSYTQNQNGNNLSNAKRIVNAALAIYNSGNNNIVYGTPTSDKDIRGGQTLSLFRCATYNGVAQDGKYRTDCNGFVALVLRDSLGIGRKKGEAEVDKIETYTFFSPDSYKDANGKPAFGPRDEYVNNFTCVTSSKKTTEIYDMMSNGEIKPGDVIGFDNGTKGTHIAIYMGDDKIIENTTKDAIQYHDLKACTHWDDNSDVIVWRATESP